MRRPHFFIAALAVGSTALVAGSVPGAQAIIGGSTISPGALQPGGEYGWLVHLLSTEAGACTGSLIAPDWVLTAAHCVPTDAVFLGGDTTPTPIESAAQRFAERLEQALDRHLGDPAFGVAELAAALHVDRATLFRRVRGSFQTTPRELLRERRLARAQNLLRERRGSVSEIAYAVGFDNLSHFSQAFRKRYGVAPSSLL